MNRPAKQVERAPARVRESAKDPAPANDHKGEAADDSVWPRWLFRPKWRTNQAEAFADDVRLMEMKLSQDPEFAIVLGLSRPARLDALNGKIRQVMQGLTGRAIEIEQLVSDGDGVMGELMMLGFVETFRVNVRGR